MNDMSLQVISNIFHSGMTNGDHGGTEGQTEPLLDSARFRLPPDVLIQVIFMSQVDCEHDQLDLLK